MALVTTKWYETILSQSRDGRAHWVLLDPDDFSVEDGTACAAAAEQSGVKALLIGGSLLYSNHVDAFIAAIKKSVSIPVFLFPGDATQLCAYADALLFLSLVSGRNPVNLIGEHVKAAPIIKKMGLEPIPTAYMLVQSDVVTSVEFMSNTRPLPRTKPMIAAAHALAATYMGMKLFYLEAGSGAHQSVPDDMIAAVRTNCNGPLIVGGGITTPEAAVEKINAGADIIVTGNLLRKDDGRERMRAVAAAVNAAR
jgi:phosphoglycerol geranylgeranyltransferase